MKKVGILYHPKVKKTEDFASNLFDFLDARGIMCCVHSSWDEVGARKRLNGFDLVVSIGGDGTILRVARIIMPYGIPIVGINFGNLGFMAELEAEEAKDKLMLMIDGEGWVDERSMVKVGVSGSGIRHFALNDVVVGRGGFMRLVNIEVLINKELFTTYRADAAIVATATGSTGYIMAANGPILFPESRDLILKAVCPHLNMDRAIVLSPETEILLRVFTNHEAIVSMDGQVEEKLENGDEVCISVADETTRFLRLRDRDGFYKTLFAKLSRKPL